MRNLFRLRGDRAARVRAGELAVRRRAGEGMGPPSQESDEAPSAGGLAGMVAAPLD